MYLLLRLVDYVEKRTHYNFYKKLRNAVTKEEVKECLMKGCEYSGSSSKEFKVMFMGRTDLISVQAKDDEGDLLVGEFTWEQLIDTLYRKELAEQQGQDYVYSEQITLF